MTQRPHRVLALDPSPEGFGYVVFELPFRLVEGHIAYVPGEKNSGSICYFERLLARFQPNAVILEDPTAPGSLRRPRVRHLLRRLTDLCHERGLAVHSIARTEVISRFAPDGEWISKHGIATLLARYFPELQEKLPPRRKIYRRENDRFALFDALALAVTFAAPVKTKPELV